MDRAARIRHTRQIRLAEVGEAGQARISASEIELRTSGYAAAIEARYLEGAGVLRVLPAAATEAKVPEFARDLDPHAREVVLGAFHALASLRAVLGLP